MKLGGKGGFTADICDCMQDSQAENDVRLQLSQTCTCVHKTDPLLRCYSEQAEVEAHSPPVVSGHIVCLWYRVTPHPLP